MNQLLYKHLRGENYNIFSSGEQKTKNKSIKRIKRTSWQRQCESCVLLPACACLCLRLPVPTWAKWGPTLAAIAACSMGTKIRCVLNIFVYIQTQTTSISSLCVLGRACVCVCTRINTYICMYLDASNSCFSYLHICDFIHNIRDGVDTPVILQLQHRRRMFRKLWAHNPRGNCLCKIPLAGRSCHRLHLQPELVSCVSKSWHNSN